MALCEISSDCLFFNDQLAFQPAVAAMMKARYCKNSNHECARYMVYLELGRDVIPTDMAPSDRMRALRMLRGAKPTAPSGQTTLT